MTLRLPIAAALLAGLLLASGCGGPPADPGPAPAPVDPQALDISSAPLVEAELPEAHVADWTPDLPVLRGEDVAPTLRAAATALAEERLVASGWPAAVAAPANEVPAAAAGADAATAAGADAATESGADAVDVAAPVWSGPEPGALELYLAVLVREPENADAVTGVDAISAELLARGRAAVVAGRVLEAQRFERIVTRALPMQPSLGEYRATLAAGLRARALVLRGESRIKAGRLLAPEGQSAVAAFRESLAAVPDFQPALDALARLQRGHLEAALLAAQRGDYDQAERLHAEAGRIIVDSPAWQDMAARLVELRRSRTIELLEQGHAAADAMDLDAAAERLADAEKVSPQAPGLDELAQRIELARHYGRFRPGQVFRDPLAGGGDAPEMVVLAHGSFTMGSPDDEAGRDAAEGPAHEVEFARGFAIARNETSVGEFAAFVQASGYRSIATQRGGAMVYDERAGAMVARDGVDWRQDFAGREAAAQLPVVHVAFEDAQAYAAWLSAQTGEHYRLPSEAEFEYALRGGRREAYAWGDGPPVAVVGNLTGAGDESRSGRHWSSAIAGYADGHWGPAPVRSYPAEAFATYDLIGNVSEWVLDCWHDSYRRAPADGAAWENAGCSERVVRGGGWASTVDRARSAWRQSVPADSRSGRVGFRVVRDLRGPVSD